MVQSCSSREYIFLLTISCETGRESSHGNQVSMHLGRSEALRSLRRTASLAGGYKDRGHPTFDFLVEERQRRRQV